MAQTARKSATQKLAPSARANEFCVDACRVVCTGSRPHTPRPLRYVSWTQVTLSVNPRTGHDQS